MQSRAQRNQMQPRIPTGVFRKLIVSLPPEELARLPAEKYPRSLNEDLISRASEENQEILNDKLVQVEANRLGRRLEDAKTYGVEIADALEIAACGRAPVELTQFQRQVNGLKVLIIDKHRKAPSDLDAISETCAKIDASVDEIRSECLKILTAIETLTAHEAKAQEELEIIQDARQVLHDIMAPIIEAVREFYITRLTVAKLEMNVLRKRVEQASCEQRRLQLEIEHMRNGLEKKNRMWHKAMRKCRQRDDFVRSRERIAELIEQKRALEVLIPEPKLQNWLDAIVNIAMDLYDSSNANRQMVNARSLLYWLLMRFCRQQEAAAAQIARNPFSQIDPEQAIDFVLKSETYILDYFTKKSNENAFWIRGEAKDKREALDDIKMEILTELRRSLRTL